MNKSKWVNGPVQSRSGIFPATNEIMLIHLDHIIGRGALQTSLDFVTQSRIKGVLNADTHMTHQVAFLIPRKENKNGDQHLNTLNRISRCMSVWLEGKYLNHSGTKKTMDGLGLATILLGLAISWQRLQQFSRKIPQLRSRSSWKRYILIRVKSLHSRPPNFMSSGHGNQKGCLF